MHRTFLILVGLSLLAPVPGLAQATSRAGGLETLEVGKPLARFSMVVPSTRIYLRYKIAGDARETMDLWRRQISFETQDGKPAMHIAWRWDSVIDKYWRNEDSWYEPGTFRPLTVERHTNLEGKTHVSGYRYQADRIIGMAELPGNEGKELMQPATFASYNFETDMELLEALPLRKGYRVRIPFYEAGLHSDPPQYYEYDVIGEDQIANADGRAMECWVVETAPTDADWGPTHFWITKRGQVMVREETRNLKEGWTLVKMLLTSDDPNLPTSSGGSGTAPTPKA